MILLMLLSVIHSPLSILNFLNSLAALAKASFENRSLAGKSEVPINVEITAFSCLISESNSFCMTSVIKRPKVTESC